MGKKISSNWFFIVFIFICCLVYSGFQLYEQIFKSPIPVEVKAEGLILDKSKKYVFTNRKTIQEVINIDRNNFSDINAQNISEKNSIIISYNQKSEQKSLYPNYLGTLYFDNEWKLALTKRIVKPVNDKSRLAPYFYYKKDKNIYVDNLLIKGDSLNQKCGFSTFGSESSNKLPIQIKNINGDDVLEFPTDGILVKNRIFETKDNNYTIDLLFNKSSLDSSSANYVYSFSSNNLQEVKHRIKIKKKSPFSLSVKSDDKFLGTSDQLTFPIQNILFTTKLKFLKKDVLFLGIFYFGLIFFNLLIFFTRNKFAKNPFQLSFVKFRFLFNCVAILSLPLLVLTNLYSETLGKEFGYVLLFLNATYILNLLSTLKPIDDMVVKIGNSLNTKFSNLNFLTKPLFQIAFLAFLALLLLIFHFKVHDERIMGIPALHVSKIAVVISYFLFSSNSFKKNLVNFFFRVKSNFLSRIVDGFNFLKLEHVLVIIYSGLISIATNDGGSLIFVLLTVGIIVLIQKGPSGENYIGKKITSLVLLFVLYSGSIMFFLNHEGSRKVYRFIYTMFYPATPQEAMYHQGDRMSFGIYNYLLKIISEKPFGFSKNADIISATKVTAHSDFSFTYGLLIGGLPFVILMIVLVLTILYNLFYVISNCFSSEYVEGAKENNITFYKSTNLYQKPFAIAIAFWLIISGLQFIVPIISNLHLYGAFLTGLPLSGFSIGKGDAFVLGCALLLLEQFYLRGEYTDESSKKSPSVLLASKNINLTEDRKRKLLWAIGISAFILGIGIVHKYYSLQKFPNEYKVYKSKNIKNFDIDYTHLSSLSDAEKYKYLHSLFVNYFKQKDAEGEEMNFYEKNVTIQIKKAIFSGNYDASNFIDYPIVLKKSQIEKKLSISEQYTDLREVLYQNKDSLILKKKIFINKETRYLVTDSSFIYPSDININNYILQAKLQKELKEWMTTKSRLSANKDKIKAVCIVLANDTIKRKMANLPFSKYHSEFEAVAQYPITSDAIYRNSTYPVGSVKKPLTLYNALKINPQYANLSRLEHDVKLSDKYSFVEIIKNVLKKDNEKKAFENSLLDNFGMYLYRPGSNTFFDIDPTQTYGNEFDLRVMGGAQEYSALQVAQWYSVFMNDNTASNKKFKELMQLPFSGTALNVKNAMNQNTEGFICKTGTLSLDGKNVSSSFAISNRNFTVVVAFFSEDNSVVFPENNQDVLAKHFFAKKALPLLKKYGVY